MNLRFSALCGIWVLILVLCNANAAPSLSLTPGGVIRFSSMDGARYQLLASEDLVSWMPIGSPIHSTNSTIELSVAFSAQRHRFFKVQVLPAAAREAFNRGLLIQHAPLQAGAGLVELGLEAVYLASYLGSGGMQLIVTGTVSLQGQQWVYEPSPTDRLMLMFQGNVFSFRFEDLQGDFSQPDVSGFLSKAHRVVLSVENTAQGINLELASVLVGTQEGLRITGRMRETDGRAITVDVTKTGMRNTSVEVSSLSYDAERRIEGTIVGEGFSMILDASELYKLRYVTRFVENYTRSYRHSWSSAGNAFQMQGAFIRIALSDNEVADLDSFWVAEGQILLNGQPYASLSLGLDNPLVVSIRVTYPEGTQDLEVYSRAN
jgi:hypothetical protein